MASSEWNSAPRAMSMLQYSYYSVFRSLQISFKTTSSTRTTTLCCANFKGFTTIADKLSPDELVKELNTCFIAFDNIIEKYNLEKIKTIGDSYMCAGGLPMANKTNAFDVVSAGLEIQQFILNRVTEKTASGKEPFQIRIGSIRKQIYSL